MPSTFDAKVFRHVVVLSVAYIAPIILADVYYFDDHFRALEGYMLWSQDGRPIADFVYEVLSLGAIVPDTYPIPLVLFTVAFAAIGALIPVSREFRSRLLFALCFVLLLFNPFFLSNLYFRYDSAVMVGAIVFAVAPFAMQALSRPVSFVFGAAALLASLSSYQAAITIFVSFAALETYSLFAKGTAIRDMALRCGERIAQLAIAFGAYSILVRTLYMHQYARDYMAPTDFDALTTNIAVAVEVANSIFSGPQGNLLLTAMTIGAAIVVFDFLRSDRKALYALVLVACAAAGIFSYVGASPLSAKPLLYPRVYVGIGGALFLFFGIVALASRNSAVAYVAVVPAVLLFFVTNIVSTNALKADWEFQRSIARSIIQDLNRLGLGRVETIYFRGTLAPSPQRHIAARAYPMVERLSQSLFSQGYDGGRYLLMLEGFPRVKYPDAAEQEGLSASLNGSNPVADNALYSVRVADGVPVIDFK